ncbi:hypothetical protein MMC07_001096 [Pseudocyphellaria aurata]|nr:hypothetical protein [Pseudocyphellaria aurata]
MTENVPFGHAMRRIYFGFDPEHTPLNHGSFGTYPAPVRQRLHACQRAAEARPDEFIRYEGPRELNRSREAIASFVNINPDEVVLIPNATTGVNIVLRSLRFEKGDVIVYFSTVYGACEKTVDYLHESSGVEGEKIQLQYPVSDDVVVNLFEEKLQSVRRGGRVARVAMFDTVSSLPGVRVPWERLVQSCKDNGVLSLVDGAHGIGHISLQHLGKADPDFFVSNCHKWLFVPRACAIFYVPLRNQHLIRSSLPTSHGFKSLPVAGQPEIFNPVPSSSQNDFVAMFEFTATIDNSPYLCIEEALKFRREICGGEEKIMKYCSELAREGGKRAAAILGTEVMGNDEETCFTNIKLPLPIGDGAGEIKTSDIHLARDWIVNCFVQDHNTFIGTYIHANSLWIRISGQIYLELEDIVWAAELLEKLCQRALTGEYLNRKPQH